MNIIRKISIGIVLISFPIFGIENIKHTYKEPDLLNGFMKDRIELGRFLNELSFKESSNRAHVVNRLGYIGKYQFGKTALKDLGLEINPSEFKKNPNILPEHIQDSLIVEYLKINKKYLKSYIEKYSGKTIKGIKLNEASILAAAHLVGHRGVKIWLNSRGLLVRKDGNNTSVEDYLKHFNRFEINVK